jgi:hypothetical protein
MASDEVLQRQIENVEADIKRVEEQIVEASNQIQEHGGPSTKNDSVVYWLKKEEQLRKEKEQLRKKEEQLRKEKELLLEIQLEKAKGKVGIVGCGVYNGDDVGSC